MSESISGVESGIGTAIRPSPSLPDPEGQSAFSSFTGPISSVVSTGSTSSFVVQPTGDQPPDPSPGDGNKTMIIVGSIIGVLAVIIALTTVITLLCCRRRRMSQRQHVSPAEAITATRTAELPWYNTYIPAISRSATTVSSASKNTRVMNWVQKNSRRLSPQSSITSTLPSHGGSQEESEKIPDIVGSNRATENHIEKATIGSRDSSSVYSRSEYAFSVAVPLSPTSENGRRTSSIYSFDTAAVKDKLMQRNIAMNSIPE